MPNIEKRRSARDDAFEEIGYSYWPAVITPKQAANYCESLRSTPVRRVICGDKDISWNEQTINRGTPLFDLFLSDQVLKRIRRCIRTPNAGSPDLRCWTSSYSVGEYINRHKDGAGNVQLVLCLRAVERGRGGTLILEYAGRRTELHLSPGDAVLFLATKVYHYTTPLLPSTALPDLERTVAVGRYFFRTPIA